MEVHCSCLRTPQKRESDLITDGCEPLYGCWDLNLGPLEKQSVLLNAEPSLQPNVLMLIITIVSDVRSEDNSGVGFPLATFAISSREGTHILRLGQQVAHVLLTHPTAPDCKF